nr:hypothetical protein CFP56_63068 [Quercus suber]
MSKRRERRPSCMTEDTDLSQRDDEDNATVSRSHSVSMESRGAEELFYGDMGSVGDALMPMDYSVMDEDDDSSLLPFTEHDAALDRAVLDHVHGNSGSLLAWRQAWGDDENDDDPAGNDGADSKPENVARRRRRAMKVAKQAADERLDDELSDWHVDEASHSYSRYGSVITDNQVAKKWEDVSSNLEQMLGVRKYSAKACKERYEATESGTALLPIELDPDQESRRTLREERRSAARKDRAEQMKRSARKARRTRKEKQRFLDEKKYQRMLERRKRDLRQSQLEQARRERTRALAVKREQRQIARDRYRLETEWQRAKSNAERTIYKNLTGKYLLGLRPLRRSNPRDAEFNESDFFSDPEAEFADADDEAEPAYDEFDDVGEMATSDQLMQDKGRTQVRKIPVSRETLRNPRSVMSMAELEVLLHERGLPRRAPREQHAQVVARLAHEDAQFTSVQLSELLGRYFDKVKGSKAVKYGRLQNHDAKHSANGKKGITSTDPDFMRNYEGYAGAFRCLLDDMASGDGAGGH